MTYSVASLLNLVHGAAEIVAEHRPCGKPYDGCYSHVPMPHCRADGMLLPCDVMALAALRASLPAGWALDVLAAIEADAGWLHDNVPDYSPDGVATLRDICRQIVKSVRALRESGR